MSIRIEDLPARHRDAALRQISAQLSKGSVPVAPVAAPTSRIRQSAKPLSNKLEAEFGRRLSAIYYGPIMEQALTFRLANGLRYTPDFGVLFQGDLILFEVKGKKAWDDSIAKLKMAASVYPQFHWYCCDKPTGTWRETIVLP